MKRRSASTDAVELQKIPNIGPAMADDLLRLGITRAEDLVERDPDTLYDELCRVDGVRHDPCVRDVFAAAVHFARGGPARPWWSFTPERKARDRRQSADSAEGAP
jgi:hypothetical protein